MRPRTLAPMPPCSQAPKLPCSSAPIRILYLHQYFNLPTDPGGTRSYEMARRLVSYGHEVHMITSDRRGRFARKGWHVTEEAGIKVHWLPVPYDNKMSYPQRIKAFFKFAVGSARRAASIPADVVFATSTPLTIAIPGVYAARRQGIPMVFEVRDLWPEVPIALGILKGPMIPLALWLEKFAYRYSAHIVALAPGMKTAIVERGFCEKKITVIPNGADIELFTSPAEGPQTEFISPEYKLITYIGTVGLANGVDYIPRLAAVLRDIHPHKAPRFAVIGDGRMMLDVKALAEELGVLDTYVFFTGPVPKKDVPSWLASSAATIMTYSGPEILYRDSVSNKFFDSLAAGKPIFANFRGFSTLTAQKAGAGMILPSDDLNEAARKILSKVYDEEWLNKAGEAAFSLAKSKFNRDHLAKKLESVLVSAVDEFRRKKEIKVAKKNFD